MGAVFLSYRRGDSSGAAGRLFDRLEAVLGRGRVFMDVDSIEPGLDFVDVLDQRLAESEVVLAVIGPNWLHASDGQGRRRIDDEGDFVRLEIASALSRGIRVIPILVDGALAISASDLPESLKALARRQAIEIRHERFGSDADQLADTLQKVTGTSRRVADQTPIEPVGTWHGEVHLSDEVLRRTWVLRRDGSVESPHNEFGFVEMGSWKIAEDELVVAFQSGSLYRGRIVDRVFSGSSDPQSGSSVRVQMRQAQ